MWPLQALVLPGAKSWGAQLDCQKHPCTSLHHAFHPMIGFSPHIIEMIPISYILSLPIWQGIGTLAGIISIIISIKSIQNPDPNLATKPYPNVSTITSKKKNATSARRPSKKS
jgi:hypothetical protein